MEMVLLTALGVGGATVIGALLGFLFKNPSHKFNDMILSFAAGVMLAAAVMGLVLPSVESGTELFADGGELLLWHKIAALSIAVAGVFAGALVLNLIDKIVPHLHKMTGADIEAHPEKSEQISKILLFVIAIGIHNLPEGIAAGVSFGTGDVGQALTVAGGIALQNIPEGMVIIAPMIASGMSRGRTFLIAMLTGIVEVIGTFIGYFAVNISSSILPFALAFAGGTMIYVIVDDIIPDTHAQNYGDKVTYAFIVGFVIMLVFSELIA